MNKKIKNEKGITLLSLVITIIVLLLVTTVIITNTKSMTTIGKLTELKNDISSLHQKVTDFYNEYGEIPAQIEYTNTSKLTNILNEKEKNSKFYVIDLQAMRGISLNNGKDYETVKNQSTQTANKYEDLYIINETTHNIFYVAGVKVNNDTYYAEYLEPPQIPTI